MSKIYLVNKKFLILRTTGCPEKPCFASKPQSVPRYKTKFYSLCLLGWSHWHPRKQIQTFGRFGSLRATACRIRVIHLVVRDTNILQLPRMLSTVLQTLWIDWYRLYFMGVLSNVSLGAVLYGCNVFVSHLERVGSSAFLRQRGYESVYADSNSSVPIYSFCFIFIRTHARLDFF